MQPLRGSPVPHPPSITRRDLLAGAALTLGALSVRGASPGTKHCPLGLASNVFDMRCAAQKADGKPTLVSDPIRFLQEAQALGAAGIQGPLGLRDEDYTQRLRKLADDAGLFVEASIMPPRDDAQVGRFENEI